MIICAVDLETSGLQVESARVLEIACALYDTELKAVFESYSVWIWDYTYPPPFQEALDINGLTVEGLKKRAVTPHKAFDTALRYFNKADAVMAHNGANFDKPILEIQSKIFHVKLPDKIWIDTRTDLDFKDNIVCRRLQHLAIDHGVTVQKSHRALFDVMTMLEVAGFYDLDKAFERAKSPMIRVEAMVPMNKNPDVKKLRYRWDARGRVWFKNIREIDFDKERDSFLTEVGQNLRRNDSAFIGSS